MPEEDFTVTHEQLAEGMKKLAESDFVLGILPVPEQPEIIETMEALRKAMVEVMRIPEHMLRPSHDFWF